MKALITGGAGFLGVASRELERRRKIGVATSRRRRGIRREPGAAEKQVATMRANGTMERLISGLATRNRGRRLSAEHRRKIADGNRRRVLGPITREKHRQKALKQWREGRVSADVGRGRRFGRPDCGGVAFRSRWEANVARILSAVGVRWEYEPVRFVFPDGSSYCPDFRLATGVFLEVKGWFTDDDARRMALLRSSRPELKVHMIGEERYRRMERHWRPILSSWEA